MIPAQLSTPLGAACKPPANATPADLQAHLAVWFPIRQPGSTNSGAEAKAACRRCPMREACLRGAVERAEKFGIWGGAGGKTHRALRRALAAGRYERVAAAHFRILDGAEQPTDRLMLQATGAGSTDGQRSTYGRGCRCEACTMAASFGSAVGPEVAA